MERNNKRRDWWRRELEDLLPTLAFIGGGTVLYAAARVVIWIFGGV